MTGPNTRAGQTLLEAFFTEGGWPDDPEAVILAIEAEAASPSALDIDEQAALLDKAVPAADFGEVARSEVMYSIVRALHERNVEIAARLTEQERAGWRPTPMNPHMIHDGRDGKRADR